MRVYHLTPKIEGMSDRSWDTTILKAECWVLAKSEEQARKKVMFATAIGARDNLGRPLRMNPWWHKKLVAWTTPAEKYRLMRF